MGNSHALLNADQPVNSWLEIQPSRERAFSKLLDFSSTGFNDGIRREN